MTLLAKTLAAALILGAASGAAFAQNPHAGHGAPGAAAMSGSDAEMMKMMKDMQPQSGDPASTKDFKEAHAKMMKDMHKPFTGDPDVDFRLHMIPHHQGAVDMARIALKHAKDPETKKMAEAVIKEQEREIGEMRDWLKKHGK